MEDLTMYYVLGFIVCLDTKEVVLIKKNKPEFQKGFYNGIGGKIEEDDKEDAQLAMSRECKEECGLYIAPSEWIAFCNMNSDESIDKVSDSWNVECFITYIPLSVLNTIRSITDEEVTRFNLDKIYLESQLLGNVAWLIRMGLDYTYNKGPFDPPTIEYTGLSLPNNLF